MSFLHLSGTLGLINVVAKATLLLIVGWFSTLLLRRAPAGARHLVWLTVIAGVLLIPALARVTLVRVSVLPSADTAPVVATSNLMPAMAAPAHVAGGSATHGATRSFTPDYGTLLVGLWLAVATALVGWLVAGLLSVGRILRGSRAMDSPEWARALRDAASRLDITILPRLVVSDRVEMAFACNALAPTIVLPTSAEEWSDDRRRAVLLHEMAHVRRHDLAGHAIARIACALYWFHPLIWAAARRLRAESEQACDDLVLNNGMRASDYAQDLLDMVTSLGDRRGAPAGALPMVRRKEFEDRLLAILDGPNRCRAMGRTQVCALAGIIGLLTTFIAAAVPVPREQATNINAPPPRTPLTGTTAEASTVRYAEGDTSTLAGFWKMRGSYCNPACSSWPAPDRTLRLAVEVHGDTVIVVTTGQSWMFGSSVLADTIVADGRTRAVGRYAARKAHWLPAGQGVVEMTRQVDGPPREDDWILAPDGRTLSVDARLCVPNGSAQSVRTNSTDGEHRATPPRVWCDFVRAVDAQS